MNNLLLDIARYGQPMLFLTASKKWHCGVEMHINITGAKFEVKAQGESPEAAVKNCHENMLNALAQLSSLQSNPLLAAK